MKRLVVALLCAVAACDAKDAPPPAPSAPLKASVAPAAKAPSSSPVRPAPSASSNASASLELLKLTWTSEIKNKEPADELDHATPGERQYVHLAVRNRSDHARTLTLIFRVNGEDRSTVPLTVQSSWRWRTWGYNTLQAGDTGDLSVEVIDDAGAVLAKERIPIKKNK